MRKYRTEIWKCPPGTDDSLFNPTERQRNSSRLRTSSSERPPLTCLCSVTESSCNAGYGRSCLKFPGPGARKRPPEQGTGVCWRYRCESCLPPHCKPGPNAQTSLYWALRDRNNNTSIYLWGNESKQPDFSRTKITPSKIASGVRTCRVWPFLPCRKRKLYIKHRLRQNLISAHLASEVSYSLSSIPLSQL